MKGHGAAEADPHQDEPHKKVKDRHTDKYHHPGSDIENSSKEQLAKMNSFKGAKDTSTEWLTKKNAVNEKINEFYYPHKGQEDI